MKISVVYLGGSRVQAGCAQETVDVVAPATLADVVKAILALHPALVPLSGNVRWARNHTIAELDEIVEEADEIALLPPVAGGQPRAVVTAEAVDVGHAVSRVTHAGAGAVVTFIGTVRDNARGQRVRQITYEVYEPMATRELDRIAVDCEREWPETRIFVAHRYGVLAVGDVAVAIAVASPHREAAFAACRAMLERIKTDVPIWKNELGENGESWVGWGGG